jgi:regulator of replication initiation timing
MNFEDFIREESAPVDTPVEEDASEIDVQKAVVEALAADKAEIEEEVKSLREKENFLSEENTRLAAEVARLKEELERALESQKKIDEFLSKEVENDGRDKVALLDRSFELPDRFEGETRDHVIEILREAKITAEKDGRLRRAQILEAVLLENEPVGILAEKRAALEKLFADNQYILNGEVINRLDKLTIQHKCGENYLLPAEIVKRLY